jgi:RHS repeat-associated protein
VISYEDYHPFGTTSFQAKNKTIKAAAKRYRYTGMERDEESGLEYHNARYYLPWLGRWLNTDPNGIGDGVNLYRYANNNPVCANDKNGMQSFLQSQRDYWAGVGDGAVEFGSAIGRMVVHPVDTASAIGTSVSQAYDRDGLLGAVNQVNPAYHAMVAGYEYYQAAQRGDFREAGRQAFRTVTNVVGTVTVAAGGAGLITGGGAAITGTVPVAIGSRTVPIVLGVSDGVAVGAEVTVPTITATAIVTIPARVVSATTVVGTGTMMMAGNAGGGPPNSGNGGGGGRGSSTPRQPQRQQQPPQQSPPPSPPRPRGRTVLPAAVRTATTEALNFLSNARGLTELANRIKGLGQMRGATVEIVAARLADGRQILVAGINSGARWTRAQLAELQRLGIEVAPQVARGMRRGPHAEENIAAHLQSIGARGERWSRAVVGEGGSYVCGPCQAIIRRAGGAIEQ